MGYGLICECNQSKESLAEGDCLLLRFHFTHCRYFLGHVACRNLPWQGLIHVNFSFFFLHSLRDSGLLRSRNFATIAT